MTLGIRRRIPISFAGHQGIPTPSRVLPATAALPAQRRQSEYPLARPLLIRVNGFSATAINSQRHAIIAKSAVTARAQFSVDNDLECVTGINEFNNLAPT
jgi:hypothetical protein